MRRELLIAGGTFLVLTLIAIGIGIGLYLGSSDGTQSNETETAPVNCKVDSWLPWSDCSVTCGNGTKTTTREVLEKPQHGGEPCPPLEEAEACDAGQCIVMLVRKQSVNPEDYFFKDFKEYQDGFAANGESWIGLDKLHRLTSERSYSLKITMTDYNKRTYHAVYDYFEVGPGEDYIATLGSFNPTLSTLGNGLTKIKGMKFSAKDRDQDAYSIKNCAEGAKGGWWYKACHNANPTGLSSPTKISNDPRYVTYYQGGNRGTSFDSWSEAEYLLVPNSCKGPC